jgi:hypothetical protein
VVLVLHLFIASILLYLVRIVYKGVMGKTKPGGNHRASFSSNQEVHGHDSEVLGLLEGSLEKGYPSHLLVAQSYSTYIIREREQLLFQTQMWMASKYFKERRR